MTTNAALFALLLLAGADKPDQAGTEQANSDQPRADQEVQRQADVARLAPAKAKMLALVAGGSPPVQAELHQGPLLRWSNPTAGSVYGEVFLWTVGGRPAATASIYRWYHPYHDATVEFASLSEAAIGAKEADVSLWDSPPAGVTFRPVPEAPAPEASRGRRLNQMRALARNFSAELVDQRGGEDVVRALRLLNRPVHRYESPQQGVIDGAMFAFVEGTDPEAWLLIEAVERTWRYALARMNVDAIRIRLGEATVASWSDSDEAWLNRKAPYTLFSFDPELVMIEVAGQQP